MHIHTEPMNGFLFDFRLETLNRKLAFSVELTTFLLEIFSSVIEKSSIEKKKSISNFKMG